MFSEKIWKEHNSRRCVMILGLEDGKVALYPHDPEWEKTAQDTIAKIKDIMGDDARDIQHVGGTSIRCAYAKPIIDIQVLVKDFSVVDRYLPQLNDMGIEYFGKILPDQCMGVIRTADGKGQTHHIHFHIPEAEAWQDIINIRDICNTDSLAGRVYSDSKLRYAVGNEDVRLNYREEKNNMYVVLRQTGQAMKSRNDGLKSGSDFIDDFFYAALGNLENEAVNDNGQIILYKKLAGLTVRTAVKLKESGITKGSRIMILTEDTAETAAALYGVLYYGCTAVFCKTPYDDAYTEERRKKTGSAAVISHAFFGDIMNYREHLNQIWLKDEDPAWITAEDETVSWKALNDAVKQTAAACPENTFGQGCTGETEEMIRMLAVLAKGGTVITGKDRK